MPLRSHVLGQRAHEEAKNKCERAAFISLPARALAATSGGKEMTTGQ